MDDEAQDHGAETDGGADDALLSRLRLIQDQPLERRAEAFVQVHEELQSALEGGDGRDR